MVAHDFTDASFGIPVCAFRGSFFQGNTLLKNFSLGPRVAPINKVQMKPGFVMAALIGGTYTKGFPRDGKCNMFVHFPKTLRARWFEKSADVLPICLEWEPGPHSGVGPGGVGQDTCP